MTKKYSIDINFNKLKIYSDQPIAIDVFAHAFIEGEELRAIEDRVYADDIEEASKLVEQWKTEYQTRDVRDYTVGG